MKKKGTVFDMRGDDKMDNGFNRTIDLLKHFNNAPPVNEEHKTSILLQLLGSAGEGLTVFNAISTEFLFLFVPLNYIFSGN